MKKFSAIALLLLASISLLGCEVTPKDPQAEVAELPALPIEDTRARNCATDTRTCSDGTIQNRIGLDCDFAACPAGTELPE